MQTVIRKVCDPVTKQVYEIQLPARAEIKRTIPQLDFPPEGFRYRNVAAILAKQFQLSDEQVNAQYKSHVEANSKETVWGDVLVFPAFRELLKEGTLEQPGGRGTPYVLAENIPIVPVKPDLNPDPGRVPEKSIEENYQQIRKELAVELLQKISENSPAFFEKLVIDLLVKMGYGGSHEDAQAVGRSGDGGIDGIIKADPLGLNVVYVQAKRWEGNVGAPPVRDFVGALDGEGVREGIFITTSDFNPAAKQFAERSSKRVILINGSELARYMINHNVGVSIVDTYEIKRVDSDYFAEGTP